jgi:hypothetical protein
MTPMRSIALLAVLLVCPPLWAQQPDALGPAASGEVRVPIDVYERLVEAAREERAPAPAAHAFGVSNVEVAIADDADGATARVEVRLGIEVFEDEWTLVPILPSGTALGAATVDGAPVQLVRTAHGLAWSTNRAGKVQMRLRYDAEVRRSEQGFVVSVPVPPAPSTALGVRHPARAVDLAIVPATGVEQRPAGEGTRFQARVPATDAVMISWRRLAERPFVMSRAHYEGHLAGDALAWRATFEVELFEGEVELPLMPSSVTLGGLRVDGERATVLDEEGRFATVVRGRGAHQVVVEFEVPVSAVGGPPRATVMTPRVPVSRFELELPGNKQVEVAPAANVVTEVGEETTLASAFVPMGEQVTFTWVDAIPEEIRAQVRAHASLYHAVHADEGVLHGRALVVYDISRGETNQLELTLPPEAQVSRITAPAGGLSDWVESTTGAGGRKTIDVFLDRAIAGEFVLDVAYEHLLAREERDGEPIRVPLLGAPSVDRERGMVALLAGPELALEPVGEERLSRVGENQLPAFVREALEMPVAHTYKFTERLPELVVRAVEPEIEQGKFDAQVDTLISIGEVTMRGAATVSVNVKSGAILALRLDLPEDVNLLGVTGPSIRSRDLTVADGTQAIDLEFTQEMDGQFRLEVSYERITGEAAGETPVPTVSVADAEVEHGRIAVEALTAVEVRPARAEQLSTLDVNELPQQLVLKTTNPILLAYKYVQPPFELTLAIERHREIDVQVAAIDAAAYATLFTRDGLAVTTARFLVRNSRRQFLRLELPPGSEVWSVFADGRAEKPAEAGDGESGDSVLIRMINSADGFPVEVVYATRAEPMAYVGSIEATLPNPDMVVTRTGWKVFLPLGPSYGTPTSNLDLVARGHVVGSAEMARARQVAGADATGGAGFGEPLKIQVPAEGVLFEFQKLYANQSADQPRFALRYASAQGHRAGLAAGALGVLALWLGVLLLGGWRGVPRGAALGVVVAGLALVVGPVSYLGTNPTFLAALAMAIGLILGAWLGSRRLIATWRARRA